jgi:ribosomal protein L44E
MENTPDYTSLVTRYRQNNKGDMAMQIRCTQCHKPFALSKEAVHAALNTITEEGLNHYNTYCPHCRRTNRVSRADLLRAAPGWKKEESGKQVEVK